LRIIVENIILFLLPACLYVGYMVLVRRTGQSPRQVMDDAPLLMLFVAGIALIAAILLAFGVRGAEDEGRPGQAYEPTVYKDGKLTPGRMK
jgi:drug/metabolite transporter (DMT)-like permease